MTTVAEIADKALDAVALKVTDAIISTTLYEPTQGAYDTLTGTYTAGETNHGAVRMVIQTERPIQDPFPDYVAGQGDQLAILRSDITPSEGWELRASKTYVVRLVQDILGNGTLFNCVVRASG